jgi:rhamnulokinase
MKEALLNLLKDNMPTNDIDLFASLYHSLAYCYKKSIEELEGITDKKYKKLYVVGGGAKNAYLNNLIAQYTGKEVVALPIEATALGNIKVQMKVSK